MQLPFIRSQGRAHNELRPLSVTYSIFPHAAASVMFCMGQTKVLCAVSITQGVPAFLRGKKTGWLTAEYALLPCSTTTRTQRESSTYKRNGRGIEISRLLGRSLRTIVNLDSIGEQTITLDCDVLSADGSTRVASLCGAYLALKAAEKAWLAAGLIRCPLLIEELAAFSIGVKDDLLLLDVDYKEDVVIDADFSFIVTRSDKIIEIHGGAERRALAWSTFDRMRDYIIEASKQLFDFFDHHAKPY